jgi:hypothetical protein
MAYSIDYKECEEYIKLSNFKKFPIFIETGTAFGQTVHNMLPYFDKIYSIELNIGFYQKAISNFVNCNNVSIYFGDSSRILAKILKEIDENIIFFLDAHSSGYDSIRGKKDVPVLEELSSIVDNVKKESIIIIDDYRLFSTNKLNEDWSEITEENILKTLGNRVISHFVNNDRFIIYLN